MASVLALCTSLATPAPAQPVGSPTSALAPEPAAVGPVGHQGRWLTDADGRVLHLNGVNLVAKVEGQTPADMGFGEDDAAWLAGNGFDVVRLGTTVGSLMPTPGVIDTTYLASFVDTVRTLTDHGLFVLVDLHQDGWGPTLGSDGFPEWMTVTHGAEDTGTEFPLYYVTNPAIQAAFDSFWGNEVGPGDVALQDRVAAIFGALAEAVGDDPGVLGYDLLNEPWPGTVWSACVDDPAGCPVQDQALDAYHARMTTAIRAEDASRLIFGEPYVLFNFGTARTNIGLPGGDPATGLSYHMYTLDVAKEPAVQDFALDWSERTGGAVLNTEFGATTDPVVIDRQVDELDGSLVPWIWWAYDESVIEDQAAPAGDDNIHSDVVEGLVRPHPRAVAGTPSALSYDNAARVLRFGYSTTRAGGGTFPDGTETSFQIAPRTYPDGYEVAVVGGTVTSAEGSPHLTVVAAPGATDVRVKVWPAGQPEPPDTEPPPTTRPPTGPLGTDAPAGDLPAVAPPGGAVQDEADFTG